jgi:predicted 3-demethylubiquinone-9 3-methyltransferase (glyoxalase superfamily)
MTRRQKIVPFLWFDDQAEEAVRRYADIVPETRPGAVVRYPERMSEVAGRPSGSVMTAELEIGGRDLVALNGGPHFAFSPATSLFLSCADRTEAETTFAALAEDGAELMPFQAYPFSEGFGWAVDRYGLSWQVDTEARTERLAPSLLFVGAQCGRAEEAMTFYTGLFPESGVELVARYEAGEGPDAAGTIKQAVFTLAGREFRVMESALDHRFGFTEAVSLQVRCDSQAEIDRLWAALSEGGDPAAQRCGWLKDRFGVSWQVTPTALPEMLTDADPARARRVADAMLQMGKLEIGRLEAAYAGP